MVRSAFSVSSRRIGSHQPVGGTLVLLCETPLWQLFCSYGAEHVASEVSVLYDVIRNNAAVLQVSNQTSEVEQGRFMYVLL